MTQTRILENLMLLKMSYHLNWLFSSLISLFDICFIMTLIFCIQIESINQWCYAWLINFSCLLILLLILCFFNSSALKTSLNFKHIIFQNKMDSIQNKGRDGGREDRYREPFSSHHIQMWERSADKVSLLNLIYFY